MKKQFTIYLIILLVATIVIFFLSSKKQVPINGYSLMPGQATTSQNVASSTPQR